MSRIKGIETRLQKDMSHSRRNGHENGKKKRDHSTEENDQVQIRELVTKLPKLNSIFDLHRKIGVGTFSSVYLGSLKIDKAVPDAARRWFAIKHLVPNTHPARVEHELRCLQEMGGKDNVIGVDLCLRQDDTIVFVMPYIPHKKFSEYVWLMDADELREYMRALLVALRRVHSFGVIHRDVKPSNFLYDRENKRYLLVDFGLAQRLSAPPAPPSPPSPPPAHAASLPPPCKRPREPEEVSPVGTKRLALDLSVKCRGAGVTGRGGAGAPVGVLRERQRPPPPPPALRDGGKDTLVPREKKASSLDSGVGRGTATCACWGRGGVCGQCALLPGARACRAGTGGFRPPEVLLKYPRQGTAVDTWAAGVVLASALCARYPFFRAGDDAAALAELADLLGSAALTRAAATLGRRLVMSHKRHGLCLRKLCARLRGAAPAPAAVPAPPSSHPPPHPPPCGHCALPVEECLCLDDNTRAEEIRCGVRVAGFPDAAFALAARLLDPDPFTRITAAEALRHPFFTDTL